MTTKPKPSMADTYVLDDDVMDEMECFNATEVMDDLPEGTLLDLDDDAQYDDIEQAETVILNK